MVSPEINEEETNLEYEQTSAVETAAGTSEEEPVVQETSAECCVESNMKVSDLLKDENMTLEQLAKMLKNI